MKHHEERPVTTFIVDCLELLGTDACASGADVGMAYRAWGWSDREVVEMVVAADPHVGLRVVTFGESPWLYGAQLSGMGNDMVQEGVLMHLEMTAS